MLDTVKAHLSPHLTLFRDALALIWIDAKNNPGEVITDVGKKAYRISEGLPKEQKSKLMYDFFYQVILAYNTATRILKERGDV